MIRDVIITLTAAGAVVLERAYFHNWTWPLMSSARWAIAGVAVLGILTIAFGWTRDRVWSAIEIVLGLAAGTVAVIGLITGNSDYLVLTMIGVVVMWATSIGHDATGYVRTHAMPQ